MKRNLPVIVLVLIILGLTTGAFWFLRSPSDSEKEDGTSVGKKDEIVVRDLSLNERPYVTLVPGTSCEYELNVTRIISGVKSLEYEIVYKVDGGVTQGVPGNVNLNGKTSLVREVLFGTESSGHRRCDKGVRDGSITIKYRDSDGKLIAKTEGMFTVLEGSAKADVEGFSVDFGKTPIGKVVVMNTIGLPGKVEGSVNGGPFGVFGSSKSKISASVDLPGVGDIQFWNGTKWTALTKSNITALGTLVKVSSE